MRFYSTLIALIFEGASKGFYYPSTYEFLDNPIVAIVIIPTTGHELVWTDRII